MTSTAEALAMGLRHHQAGDLAQAERLYRQVLQAEPGLADARFLLGTLCLAQGRLPEATSCLQAAARLQPGRVEAHSNLGVALAQQGRLDEAVASFRQALRLQPGSTAAQDNLDRALRELARRPATDARPVRTPSAPASDAEAHHSRALASCQKGQWAEAEAHFRQALRLRPDHAEAHYHLGLALRKQGRPVEAEKSFREALRLHPDFAEAFNNLGGALLDQRRLAEAVDNFRQALRLRADYAEALNRLGIALLEQGQLEEAAASFRQVVRLQPDHVSALNNLGVVLREQGQLEQAVETYRQALRLQPDDDTAHYNLGMTLQAQGRLEAAEASYDSALRLLPDSAPLHYGRSMVRLQLGDFERGWPEYEWRLQREEARPPDFRRPPWDGSSLKGKTILLYHEQGLGDTFQFVRYAPLVRERGGRVLLACPPRLRPLLSGCPGIDQLVGGDLLPDFDVWASLMSLPCLFGTTLPTVPARVPYISPPADLVERWRRQLGAVHGFKVGIAWQGNPTHGNLRRSAPLSVFEPLARVPGVRLVCLQQASGTEQLGQLAGRFTVLSLGEGLDGESGAFADTAAVMRCLDLVVSIDTSVVHLAGALAVPVWVALPCVAEWRWLLGREDSPWYPTLRLFRQTEPGDWEGVFRRMAAALEPRAVLHGGGQA